MPRYAFADFVLAPGERSLAREGRAVKLGARAFDVLLVLVEHRDRTVSKQELLDRVWPKLVVEENNLQVQVATLRKLLGAPAIATIPGRGYRFTLPVRIEGDASTGATAPADRAPAAVVLRPDPLVGRDADLAAVRSLLAGHGVLTIAGAGGIGKTRVAQALAATAENDFPAGVYWIEFGALADPSLVVPTIARVVGVVSDPRHDPLDAVLASLRTRRALLVLDNCEHVLDAVAAFVHALRGAAPDVRVLTTSQEPLHAADEHVYRLGPLALPDSASPASAASAGAVALFAARASSVDPRFRLDGATVPAVVEICRRLDGIPLAIELAAARVPLLGLEGVRARLDERFRLLTAGSRVVLRRHQTLRAALEWSYGLLADDEQAVLRRLGVFAGTFTLEFAQVVAADERIDAWGVLDRLGALVDKSLVNANGEPVPRYRLLETTRAFALERLAEAGETERTLRRHAQALIDWLDDLVERRRRLPLDPAEEAVVAPELDNVRAALDWAYARREDALAVALAGASPLVWMYGGAGREGWERLLALRERLPADLAPRRAIAFWHAITALGVLGAKAEAFDAARSEVALLRGTDDHQLLYMALQRLAMIAARRGDVTAARAAIDEAAAIERPSWPARYRANLLFAVRALHTLEGRHEDALACARRQVELYAQENDESRRIAEGAWVAECEANLGRLQDAERRALDALQGENPAREGWGYVHAVVVLIATLRGEHERAMAHGRRALADLRRLGDEARVVDVLALSAALQGRLADAALAAGYADAEHARDGVVRPPPAAQRRARLADLLAAGLAPDDLERCLAAGARMAPDDLFAVVLGDAIAGEADVSGLFRPAPRN